MRCWKRFGTCSCIGFLVLKAFSFFFCIHFCDIFSTSLERKNQHFFRSLLISTPRCRGNPKTNRCVECNTILWCSLTKLCGSCVDRMNINIGRKERARKIQQFKIEYAQRMKEEAEANRKKKIQENKEREEEEKKEEKMLKEKMEEEEILRLKEEEEKRLIKQKEKRDREEETRKVLRAKKKMKLSTSEAIEKLLGGSLTMSKTTTITSNGHLQYVSSNGYHQNVGESSQGLTNQTTKVSPSQDSEPVLHQQNQDSATKSSSTSSTKNLTQKQNSKESSETRNKEMEDILNLDTVDNTPTGMDGSVWYIMSESWLRSWRHYVFGVQSAPRPGSVDNWALLESHDENDFKKQKAKEGLRQVEDYRGVNRMVWEYFVNIYGGGPAIVRKDLDIHLPPLDPKSLMRKTNTLPPVLNANNNNNFSATSTDTTGTTTTAAAATTTTSKVALEVST